MEFNEKLQKLRTSEHLTQEELAEKLYVSRTAISKWESGRGYPSIESLKAIAAFFHITIDALIGGAEILTLAEQDKKESGQKYTALVCGILDCLAVLLLLLPLFGNGGEAPVSAVALPAMTGVGTWLKAVFIGISALTVLYGFYSVVTIGFDRPLRRDRRYAASLLLSVFGTATFVLARQPYAGVFCLCLLVIKGFLMLKSK